MLTKLLLVAALAATAAAQFQPLNRPINRQLGGRQLIGQPRTITLDDGQLLQIDARTLRRLEEQGVDVGNLDNLSDAELQRLGIGIRAVTIAIPGAVQRLDGIQEIRLPSGVIMEIDQVTLRRLQNQGIDVTTIPNLSERELRQLGIRIREETILIPGAVQLAGGEQQIRLRNGIIVVIDRATLQRLQSQGVDVNSIPDLTPEEARRLGIRIREETIIIPGAVQLGDGQQEFVLSNGAVVTVTQSTLRRIQEQGVNVNSLTTLTEAELRRLGLIPRTNNVRIPGATVLPNGAQQFRLRNGVLLNIDAATLRRLLSEGVDVNTLPNLSEQELQSLGIRVTESITSGPTPGPITIPGAIRLPDGSLQIRLRNGVLVVIDQQTLRRLQVEGVDLNTIPNLSQQELIALGIRVTETVTSDAPLVQPITIPGAIRLPNGSLQVRLRNGVLIVIDQQTLRRLRVEGVNLNTIPNLSQEELRALGIRVTETVTSDVPLLEPITIDGAIRLPNGNLQIRLRDGDLIVIDQQTLRRLQREGVNLNSIPNLSQAELRELGIRVTESIIPGQPIIIPGGVTLPGGSVQIRLRNGVLVVIDQQTLRRLRLEGVDLNTLPNLSQEELRALGIRVTESVTSSDQPLTIPGAIRLPNGSLQVRLRNGVLIVIDQQTLRRLRVEGVNLNTIPNLSQQELIALGIRVTETVTSDQPLTIPGAIRLPNGSLQIRLRNGVLIVIDQQTLRRLQVEGVDLNTIPNLSQEELRALGIRVTETVTSGQPILIPGAVTLPGGSLQIRLRNGVLVVIDQQTLRRLRVEGVDLNTLPNLSQEELIALGIRVTESVTSDQPLRAGVIRRIIVDGQTIVVPYTTLIRLQSEGIDINNLQSLTREELIRLRVISSGLRPLYPRPQDEGLGGAEFGEPRPEPFNFAYTSETEDGSSSSHQASQTRDGVVTGSYTIRGANGQERRVDYVADAGGYRATVTTNGIGTESQNTADAVYQSSAPTAAELSRQYTPLQPIQPLYRTPVGQPLLPAGRRGYQGQNLAPLPIVRVDQRRGLAGRLTAAPESELESESREPAASEQAGVQYTDDSREFGTVKIAA